MKIKKRIKKIALLLVLFIIGFLSFMLYQTRDEINADLSNIDAKLNRYYDHNRMGGFAISVFTPDTIIFSKGYGYANVEEKIPYTTETQQYLASISKTSIGLALMKAEELDLLSIEDPINKYLPFKIYNPLYPKEEITLEQLATHTSSLDYNEQLVESLYVNESQKEKTLSPFMKDYFQNNKYDAVKFTNSKPGSDWNYSNIGASLAAYVIEIVSGTSFSDFTDDYIFKPLEMTNSYWMESESDSILHTQYYEPKMDSIVSVKTGGVVLYPSRDMITNINDLTKYCQAIMSKDPKLLNTQSFDKLLSPKLSKKVTNLEDDNNGIFFFIDRNNYGINYSLTGMDGGDNCIKTMMWFDPKTQLGYIFLGNTGGSEINRINHIVIYNALVSLGYNYSYSKSNFKEKVKLKWHNLYNRIVAIF